jgi:hypothetical protein
MSTSAIASALAALGSRTAERRTALLSIAIWLAAALIAIFFALVGQEATVVDGVYVPRGNDSFYHARRILDAAVGSRGFYQFDERLHAPDGSWISWPWAYDYLLAKVTQLAIWLVPTIDPMAVISYVPVLWIFVNAALFMAAAGEIGLSRELRLLAMLCFALSPLTQMLHSIAMIDHHYVEHTFVLLNAWLGLRWFKQPDDRGRAIALGIALGAAPAFHNGLFVLQLVPLAGAFVLWLRGTPPARGAAVGFAAALVATTQLVLLPSEPYRRGMFEFGLMSWFHFYVAVCTAAVLVFVASLRYTRRSLALLGALCFLLTLPLVSQAVGVFRFAAGSFSLLEQIVEVRSPYRLFTDTLGPVQTTGFYSWLVLLAPLLLVYYGYRVLREQRPERLYYALVVAFGLALLLDQWRLHYFGFFGLITGGLLVLDELRARRGWHRGAVFVAAFAAIFLAYQPALRTRLFALDVPGEDFAYANVVPAFNALQRRCAEAPGVVLASSSDGAPILFHTECSVIATNFILREADAAHIDEVTRLMWLTPAEIRAERPDVRYLLVRAYDFAVLDGGQYRLAANNPLVNELLLSDSPPEGYTLLLNLVFPSSEGKRDVYARLYEISHAPEPSG